MNKRRVGITTTVIILVALTGEMVAKKVIGLGSPPLYESREGMEYKLKPNQNIRRFGNRIVVNNASMRTSSDITNKTKSGKQRILIFGDSVLWGGSQMDQENIATAILGKKLKDRYEIYNVSAGSWGPGNWNEYIKENGLFNADQVIFLISTHDLTDIPYTVTTTTSHNQPTENPVFASWELLNRYIVPSIQKALTKIIPKNEKQGIIDNSSQISEGTKILNLSIDLVFESGAELTAVQFWDRNEVSNESPQDNHSITKNILRKKQVRTIQSLPYFTKCSDKVSDLFTDSIHPNTKKGQKCLALVLENAIIKP